MAVQIHGTRWGSARSTKIAALHIFISSGGLPKLVKLLWVTLVIITLSQWKQRLAVSAGGNRRKGGKA